MPLSNNAPSAPVERSRTMPGAAADGPPAPNGAVSWPAIFAGAAAASALSLILLVLGTGLGLAAVSPWSQTGVTATTFGVSTILWITLTQLVASAMGGYLAGRLRVKWVSVHTDEVFFRDTAHGFLAWAVATLATAALLTSVIGSITGGVVRAGTAVAGGAAAAATAGAGAVAGAGAGAAASAGSAAPTGAGDASGPMGYAIDSLFRKEPGASAPAATAGADSAAAASGAEAARIVANAMGSGALPPADAQYLGQMVAQRTGLSQADAQKRVTDMFTRLQTKRQEAQATAKDAADKARKASSYAALWLFVSLLVGAFFASLSATFGGRQRDA